MEDELVVGSTIQHAGVWYVSYMAQAVPTRGMEYRLPVAVSKDLDTISK